MALKAHLEANSTLLDERRDERRTLMLETSGSLPSGEQSNVLVHNISGTGLLLETSLSLDSGEALVIDLPEAGKVGARVVWRSGILFGCQFDEPLSIGPLSAIQLAGSAPLAPEIGRPATRRKATGELFGKRLEKLRKQRGLTLAQVADELGVSKPTVWAWEKGKARPVEERLPAIANVLGIPEEDLSSFSEPPGIAELLQSSREQIAEAYGTSAERVKIFIEV